MSVIEEIAAERRRQIKDEGWAPEHDDKHTRGEMMTAAMCYFIEAAKGNSYRYDGTPDCWPWGADWWKPKDARRNLVRAGALCLAEKERFERAGHKPKARASSLVLDGVLAEIERLDRAVQQDSNPPRQDDGRTEPAL